MRILLVGYGKMGRLIGELASQYGGEVAGIVDPDLAAAGRPDGVSAAHPDGVAGGRPDGIAVGGIEDARWKNVDVAIDFTAPDAVRSNVPALAARGINVVLGTTGWQTHEPTLRQAVAAAGTGIVAAPNFSTGVVLFEAIVAQAAKLFAEQPGFGAYLHEAHHAMKKDAPSGTALLLKSAMERSGYVRPIDVSSTRAGFIPGTHTIGFDGQSESITLAHTARDRGAFARGALLAARWVQGRHGWFSMHDVLGVRQ